jgi:hypothetical protein
MANFINYRGDFTLAPGSMPITVEQPPVDEDEDDLTQSQFN